MLTHTKQERDMTTNTAGILIIMGLIITMGGVGGIELSTDAELLAAMIISVLGLMIMYTGVIALRVSDYYDAE